MTYIVISDLHLHDWSLFSNTTTAGINSRLEYTLDELKRAASEAAKHDTPTLVIAGDIFHQRGVINPEVLNPTRDAFAEILGMGVSVIAIPGNHDLKSRETQEISSAIQNLVGFDPSTTATFEIFNETAATEVGDKIFGFVPWCDTEAGVKSELEKLAKNKDAAKMDVFIHAGIDGVINGLGGVLDPAYLSGLGFKRVFAGHYHNHKDLGDGIYSIGATTHHNWGDIGARAGFLTVDDSDVTFNDTMAPKFVDISGMDDIELKLEVPRNYVRFRGDPMTQEDVKELRDELMKMGALGVSIEVPKVTVSARPSGGKTGQTLDQSVATFIADDLETAPEVDPKVVATRAAEILNDVRTVKEDT